MDVTRQPRLLPCPCPARQRWPPGAGAAGAAGAQSGRLREGPPSRMRSLLGRGAAGSGHPAPPSVGPGSRRPALRVWLITESEREQPCEEREITHPRSLPPSLFLAHDRPCEDGGSPRCPSGLPPTHKAGGKRLLLSQEAACALPPPQPLPEAPSEAGTVGMAGRTRRPRGPSPPMRGGAATGHPPGPPPLPARGPSAGRCRAGRCRPSRQRPLRGGAGRARESRRCRGGRASGGAGGGFSREQSGGGAATRWEPGEGRGGGGARAPRGPLRSPRGGSARRRGRGPDPSLSPSVQRLRAGWQGRAPSRPRLPGRRPRSPLSPQGPLHAAAAASAPLRVAVPPGSRGNIKQWSGEGVRALSPRAGRCGTRAGGASPAGGCGGAGRRSTSPGAGHCRG